MIYLKFHFSILLYFVCLITDLNAQSRHCISLGPDLAIPTKNIGGSTPVSIGGSVQYQLKFKAPVGVQVHIGYNKFGERNIDQIRFLPVRIGLIGYIFEDLLFAYADAGISHYNSPTTATKQNGFTFGAGLAYKLPINRHQFIQLSAYYNLHNFRDKTFGQNFNYNWYNIRAAFGFSFGKSSDTKKEK